MILQYTYQPKLVSDFTLFCLYILSCICRNYHCIALVKSGLLMLPREISQVPSKKTFSYRTIVYNRYNPDQNVETISKPQHEIPPHSPIPRQCCHVAMFMYTTVQMISVAINPAWGRGREGFQKFAMMAPPSL